MKVSKNDITCDAVYIGNFENGYNVPLKEMMDNTIGQNGQSVVSQLGILQDLYDIMILDNSVYSNVIFSTMSKLLAKLPQSELDKLDIKDVNNKVDIMRYMNRNLHYQEDMVNEFPFENEKTMEYIDSILSDNVEDDAQKLIFQSETQQISIEHDPRMTQEEIMSIILSIG